MKTTLLFIIILSAYLLTGCDAIKPGVLLISQPLILLQNITAIMAFLLAASELTWMIRVSEVGWWKSLYAVGMLAYAIHVCVYYVVATLVRLDIVAISNQVVFLTDWSSILRFHDIGLLLSVSYQRLRDTPRRKVVTDDIR